MLHDALLELDTAALTVQNVRRALAERFREIRARSPSQCFLLLLHWKELTKETDIICSCGLEPDIRKRLTEGHLSVNQSWTEHFDLRKSIARFRVSRSDRPQAPLLRQFDVVFNRHPTNEFNAAIVRCDATDRIILLEARDAAADSESVLERISDQELALVAERVYLSLLKDLRRQVVSDWEKAVHELASPLDFIYSNSDFLIRYLASAQVDETAKIKKLQDFQIVATLLINRLHQFRFAFAGFTSKVNRERLGLFDICMPITHLWHHEARRKNLRFDYEGLKNLPFINTDKEILQFILFNLVSNAIKYSYPKRDIQLYGHVRGDGRWTIGIRNQGIPISAEDQNSIFNYGFRSREACEFDSRGMGLGLAVCRQLCRTLQGSIYLVPDTDPWTTFEFSIPGD